jgi:short-subunit dehydrogenase
VFGAGPGLGQAVAGRYAREGYDVVLVARRRDALEQLATDLSKAEATVRTVVADLADPATTRGLLREVRDLVGSLDVIYYAPTPDVDFVAATGLTVERAGQAMSLGLYSLIDLVQHLLPDMLDRGNGAILTAQGASTLRGLPNLSGPGPAQAAQRNYLQSLHAEVADRGVYVGMLYVGAIIEGSAFHAWTATSGGDARNWGPTVSPDYLADLLWNMHSARGPAEASYPEDILVR